MATFIDSINGPSLEEAQHPQDWDAFLKEMEENDGPVLCPSYPQ
jgi:hypothetical protein